MLLTDAEHWNERHGCANGFILPLTLWMIAIIGLLAATLNVWVAETVANSRSLAQRTQLALTQANFRNELVYMLGTRPSSYRGLEIGPKLDLVDSADITAVMVGATDSGRTLEFDGRSYVAENDPNLILALQDGAGLLNLNATAPQNMRRALTAFNVPEPQINRLIDTLLDYIDDDDLTRLAGAEKAQYERLGLPPPANGLLLSPLEAQRIIGWDSLDALWEAEMESPILTTCQSPGFNLNSAPPRVLIANIRGMTQDKVDQVLAKRAQRPFRNIREFAAAADILITDEPFFYEFAPGRCVVVDMIDQLSEQHMRFSLTLEPISQTRPWRVDYATRIPTQHRSALDRLDPQNIFPTPESIDLSPRRDDGRGTGAGSSK